jgi:hypothetical protein
MTDVTPLHQSNRACIGCRFVKVQYCRQANEKQGTTKETSEPRHSGAPISQKGNNKHCDNNDSGSQKIRCAEKRWECHMRANQKAEPRPTLDLDRGNRTDSTNVGWLRRLVILFFAHSSSHQLPSMRKVLVFILIKTAGKAFVR